MTKEEKIVDAYGEHWEGLHPAGKECALKNDGWVGSIIELAPKGLDLEFDDYSSFRPKSLLGIENNNGWVKINRESDLPNEDFDCFIIDKIKGLITGQWKQYPDEAEDKRARTYWIKNATHYKLIKKPKMPLY